MKNDNKPDARRHYLIDMDGVLADFVSGFRREWARRGLPPYFENWNTWEMSHHVPEHERHLFDEVMATPGLFRDLPVIPGAVEALRALVETGHEVHVCSTPIKDNHHCIAEKLAWLHEHFGSKMVRQFVFTHDKTLVHGDILIDDKPKIVGARVPTWEHVFYTQPYNVEIKDHRRRLTWANWRDVLGH